MNERYPTNEKMIKGIRPVSVREEEHQQNVVNGEPFLSIRGIHTFDKQVADFYLGSRVMLREELEHFIMKVFEFDEVMCDFLYTVNSQDDRIKRISLSSAARGRVGYWGLIDCKLLDDQGAVVKIQKEPTIFRGYNGIHGRYILDEYYKEIQRPSSKPLPDGLSEPCDYRLPCSDVPLTKLRRLDWSESFRKGRWEKGFFSHLSTRELIRKHYILTDEYDLVVPYSAFLDHIFHNYELPALVMKFASVLILNAVTYGVANLLNGNHHKEIITFELTDDVSFSVYLHRHRVLNHKQLTKRWGVTTSMKSKQFETKVLQNLITKYNQ